jgi:uncharacterized cupin superfamily protein
VAGYALLNLKDVEDLAPKFGHSPNLEARFAREALGCEQSGLSYQRLAPNVQGPFGHRHRDEEEIYVVVGGSGRIKLEDEVLELRSWDAVRVAPETARAFAAGPDGLELLVFGARGLGIADTEMLPQPWADD